MQTLWKFRVIIVVAALILVAGGAVVVGAKGLVGGDSPRSTAGSSEQHQPSNDSQEPTKTKGPEPTATPASSHWAGKIVSIDCAKGTITITPDGGAADATATAQMQQGAGIFVSGKSAVCGDLKVGWHVTLEVKQINGQWVAIHVTQDDSGQSSGGGDGNGGGDGHGGDGATPTPAPSH